jgi:two-component system nitrogen regulation sensor histidine kinase GlnL
VAFGKSAGAGKRFQAFDLLSTLIAVVRTDGSVLFANSGLEDALGTSRRTLEGSQFGACFHEPQVLRTAIDGARSNDFATLRYEALLRRVNHELMPVQVTLAQSDKAGELIIEMSPLEQQVRQDREERLLDQAQANKELIRNLAHEIKNPLGGIRGAAQLLEFELGARERDELREYTQVVIKESDRLQTLVDRLLEPHRHPHIVGDVNIHEVCERVRQVILAEFPRGLTIERDYDVSVPDLRGDKEQLIQALLNIVRNAAEALRERISQGDAKIELRTRIARKVTIGKRLHKLALDLHITDNGPGIPGDIRDRIFYPLVSGRDDGSGLGLTLAQSFVQQHDGLIEVESRPGCTEFAILLPFGS